MAELVRELAAGRDPRHPVLDAPGWWRRPERLLFPGPVAVAAPPSTARPLLVAGGSGTLGRAFARVCRARGLPYVLLTRADLDIADPASVAAALDRFEPWAVVNAAGYVRVDAAEGDSDRCRRENARSARPSWPPGVGRPAPGWSRSRPTLCSTGGPAGRTGRTTRSPR